MCSREALSNRCILLKRVPDEVDENILERRFPVPIVHHSRYNELSCSETRWILLLESQQEAQRLIKSGHVTLNLERDVALHISGCPECIIPDEWMDLSFHKSQSMDREQTEDSGDEIQSVPKYRVPQLHRVLDDDRCTADSASSGLSEKDSFLKSSGLMQSESQSDTYRPTFKIPSLKDSKLKTFKLDSDQYENSIGFQEVLTHPPKSFTSGSEKEETFKKTLEPLQENRDYGNRDDSDEPLQENRDSGNRDDSDETGYENVEEVIRSDAGCQFPSMSADSQPPPIPPRLNRTSSKNQSGGCPTSVSSMTSSPLISQGHPKTNIYPRLHSQVEADCLPSDRKSLEGRDVLATFYQNVDSDGNPQREFTAMANNQASTSRNEMGSSENTSSNVFHPPVTTSSEQSNRQSHTSEQHQSFQQSTQGTYSANQAHPMAMPQLPNEMYGNQQVPGKSEKMESHPEVQPPLPNRTQPMNQFPMQMNAYQQPFMQFDPRQLNNYHGMPQNPPFPLQPPVWALANFSDQVQNFQGPPTLFPGQLPPYMANQACPPGLGNVGPATTEIQTTEAPLSEVMAKEPISDDESEPNTTEESRHSQRKKTVPTAPPKEESHSEKRRKKTEATAPLKEDSHSRKSKKKTVSSDSPKEGSATENVTLNDTIEIISVEPLTEDAIQFYFENKKKSGGGDIHKLDYGTQSSDKITQATIKFSNPKTAQSVLQKKDHTICKVGVTVKKYEPGENVTHGRKKSEENHEPFDTIKVKLEKPLTEDTIIFYFENKKKSGGGEIESIDYGSQAAEEIQEAFITFKDHQCAKSVVEKKNHIISSTKVTVQKYDPNDPSMWEPDKILVEGLNPKITEECLFNFLEPRADATPTDIIHGSDADKAIVVFEEKPDLKKLSKECQKRPLEGSKLQIQMVEKCNSVLVEGVNKETSVDLLDNFFANTRRSGGGDVDDLHFYGDDGYCIIYFENPSDAMNVYKKNKDRTLNVGVNSLHVFLYFPCLGVPEQLLQAPVDLENLPVIICSEYDPHALKFLKKAKEVCKDIEGKLQKKFAKLEWLKSSSQLELKIVCTVKKESIDARKILKTWEKDSRQVMDEFMDNISVEKQSVVAEVWDVVLKELKTMIIDDSEKVAVSLEKKNHVVVIVGYKGNTDALTKTVCQIVQKAEKNVKERITKTLKPTFIQCKFLYNSHFHDRAKKEFPNIEIEIEINKKEVTLKGDPSDVHKAVTKMYESISDMKSKSKDISKSKQKLFSSKAVRDMFIEETKKRKIQVAWNVKDDKLEMHAQNMSIIDKGFETFSEFIQEKVLEVPNLLKILTQPEWQNCVKELRENHKEKLDINSSKTAIVITSTDDIFEEVVSKIDDVIKKCSKKYCTKTEYLEVSYGEFAFMKYYCDNEIKKVIEVSEDVDVKKDFKNHCFELIGDSEKISEVKRELERITQGICTGEHKIKGSAAKNYFSSEKGKDTLLRTGKASSCVIISKEYANQQEKPKWSKARNTDCDRHRGHGRPNIPFKRASCKMYDGSKGRQFIVMEGDVTKLNVDVIVNAANGDLDHCGGLAKAISDAGGRSVQEESDRYKNKYGQVNDGDAVSAGAGRLPCKMLVHAVGPRWNGGNNNEESLLRNAVLRSLSLTDQKKHFSIAIPALSAGIFGYPVMESIKTIIDAIRFYFKSKEGKDSSIMEIYFCDVDETIVSSFIKTLKKIYGEDVVLFDSDEREDDRRNVHERGRGRHEGSGDRHMGRQLKGESEGRRRSTDRYSSYDDSPEEFTVKIIPGELAKMKTDVIVNSAHHTLDLSIGATSKSLLIAGGQQLQDECQTKFPKGLTQGQIVITKGGRLKCSQVYHGTLKSWDRGRGDALDTFKEFVYECLNTAAKNNLASIAFPALGTGKLGYPADVAAKAMLKCVHKFHRKNPTSSLTTINIVVFHEDRSILQAFKYAESKVEEESKTKSHDDPERGQRQNRGANKENRRSTSVGDLDVQIRQGDITKESVDVIVNSVGEHLDLSKGAVSKAILRAAGSSIQDECKRGAQHMRSDGFIVTSPGNMSCKMIIHVKAQKTADGWERMVTKALTHADKCGYQSIAFPALGTGALACDPEDVAKAMFVAMRKFSTDRKLKFVRVLVFQEDMVRMFVSTLKSLPQGFITKVKDKISSVLHDSDEDDEQISGHRNPGRHPRQHSKHMENEWATLLIWSKSEENIRKAKKYIDRVFENECTTESISGCSDVVKNLSQKQVAELRRMASNCELVVDTYGGTIQLQGQKTNVLEAKANILEYVHKLDNQITEREKAQTLAKFVQWQYEESKDKWRKFPEDVNYQIEKAKERKERTCVVRDRSGGQYVIDLHKMEEYEKGKQSKVFKIQRLDKGQRGSNAVGIPEKWTPMKPDKTVIEVTLKPGDAEFEKVKSEFIKSAQGAGTIAEIRRVQNPHLYQQYAAKRKELQTRNQSKPEKWLWHGTSANTVDNIINNGFNRSYCGKNGTAFGNGVYFAVNASYSIGYCHGDGKGQKHMFSAQVLTGESCQGSGGMNVLPQKPGASKSYITYDSATNSLSNPQMYIIFHDSQAYPAYHIIFS